MGRRLHSVAISGQTVVVGSYLDDDGDTDAGSAYVFNLADANKQTSKEKVPVVSLDIVTLR